MSSIQAKRNIWWSAPPHPIPPHPFAMFRREKFCTDFQKASDAVPITCFHLSSPSTDTTLLTDGKSRVPRLCCMMITACQGLAAGTTLLAPQLSRSTSQRDRSLDEQLKTSWNNRDPQQKTTTPRNTARSYCQTLVPATLPWLQSKCRDHWGSPTCLPRK